MQPYQEEAIARIDAARAAWKRRILCCAYVEIWCEKDALAGVLVEETDPYDVPLMVSRGFSSDTYLEGCAQAIRRARKPAFIYQFGDHDPSGVLIASTIEKGLRRHAPGAEIHFERIAVTPRQIEEWHLPSRPTKRDGNTHTRDFAGDSVELDAIPAYRLRALCRDCIERHIDHGQLAVSQEAEKSERQLLSAWCPYDIVDPGPEGAAQLLQDEVRASLWFTRRERDRLTALERLDLAVIWLDEFLDTLPFDHPFQDDFHQLADDLNAAIAAIDGDDL